MTAFNFCLNPKGVYIAMDTMGVFPETKRPFMYTSKIFPLPHLGGVMCGTGVMLLVIDWFTFLLTKVLARDVVELDRLTPDALRSLAEQYDLDSELTVTIYHFGYCEPEERYRGFAYRSTSNFASDELPYGIGTKPPLSDVRIQSLPEDFIKMINQQRLEDRNNPVDEQVGIGGDVHFFVMTTEYMALQRCHRFDDYEENYREMVEAHKQTKSMIFSTEV
jgi:hypothetical protein